ATWVDWTFYYENVPSSELALVVRLEAERMQRLVLREPQVKSEKEVVANERRYRVDDDVEGAVNELLYKTAFTVHPYHWPTIGWMHDIENFTTEDCAQFYGTYYAPNNANIAVVGDFEEDAILALIDQHYGSIPAAQLPPHLFQPEPEQTEERRLEVEKPTPTEKLSLGYRSPALGDAAYAPLTVLNEVLFGGKSSRLYRALISEGELASEARGSISPSKDPGLFEVWVSLREGHVAEEALGVVEAQFNAIISKGITEAELDKAKNRLELGFLHGMETASGKAEQIGMFETVLGDAGKIFAQLDAFRAVSIEDVRQVAEQRLRTSARTTLIVRAKPEDDDAEAA
ncbi:MAG: pitrilysin family protein, partial [Polyangiales bacterium]